MERRLRISLAVYSLNHWPHGLQICIVFTKQKQPASKTHGPKVHNTPCPTPAPNNPMMTCRNTLALILDDVA